MDFGGFEWDRGNREKCQKHGVPLEDIELLFRGQPLVGPDLAHSTKERRFRAVGYTQAGRALFVIFTWRQTGSLPLIRPISARYMHKKEVESYEKDLP